MMLLLYLLLLILAAVGTVLNEPVGGPDLCVVQTPLVTRHFKSWRQGTAVPTRGCWNGPMNAAPTNKPTQEVHVIRLMNAATPGGIPTDVTLEIAAGVDSTRKENGSSSSSSPVRLVLILDAPNAVVRWNIRTTGSSSSSKMLSDPLLQHTVVVTGDSELDQSDLRVAVTSRPGNNRDSLARFVERRFKTIHSVGQIDKAGGVNRIRLSLLGNGNAGNYSGCENGSLLTSTQASPVLEAWRTGDAQLVEGCFHSEQAGTYPRDVHIVELDGDRSGTDGVRDEVRYVHLAAGREEEDSSRPRNIALVLKSARPVRWVLSSSPSLTGNLMVTAELPSSIADNGLSGQLRTEMRLVAKGSIPDSFALLILFVTADLGPPVSYVKTPPGTRFVELVISKKTQSRALNGGKHQQQQQLVESAASHSLPSMEMGVRSLDRGAGNQPITPNSGNRGSGQQPQRGGIAWTLQQGIRVQCISNHLTASLSRPVSEALGVKGLHLSDRNCLGKLNASHWTIRAPVTSCGSTSRIDGKLTTYSNLVHVQLGNARQGDDDEDVEGSGSDGAHPATNPARYVIIPIQCHSELNFPMGQGLADHEADDDDNVMDAEDLNVGHMELYHMDIYRNKEWTKPVIVGTDNSRNKAEVVFDETLHVRTWIDGVSYIRIVMEKCWVSNSSDSDAPPRLILIRNTCPADLSVQLRDAPQDSSDGFSFHVSKDYGDMGQLYVHCKLGLCTNKAERAQGNLRMCVEPSQYCTGRHVLRPFLDETVSTAQQILVRGPLRMVSKILPVSNQRTSVEVTTASPNPVGQPNSQVIVVGVSTEVTVGIGLACFVMGVALTAILWCIHTRTDPYRRVMNRKCGSNKSGVNNRCPGIIKCGSPMTRARMAGDQNRKDPEGQQQLASQQQHLMPSDEQAQLPSSTSPPPSSQYHQFSYDYDVSSSQSHQSSGGSQCGSSREDSSPTPNSQTPMNVGGH